MLRIANASYAPANCSTTVRKLAASGHGALMSSPFQRGLLEAAKRVVHPDGGSCEKCRVELRRTTGFAAVLQNLMEIAEQSGTAQLLSLLNWRKL